MTKEIKILLVDNNPLVLEVLEQAARTSFPEATFSQVFTTAQAIASIDGLTDDLPSFIIVSIESGDANNGFHFLSFLKARKLPFMAPVFLLTDRPTKDDAVDAHQLGAASYVAKPDNVTEWGQYLALIRLHYIHSL